MWPAIDYRITRGPTAGLADFAHLQSPIFCRVERAAFRLSPSSLNILIACLVGKPDFSSILSPLTVIIDQRVLQVDLNTLIKCKYSNVDARDLLRDLADLRARQSPGGRISCHAND